MKCEDPSCKAFRAGIPHEADAAHNEILDVVKDMRAMKYPGPDPASEIKRLQAERDHCQKRIGQCILLGAVVLIGGMFVTVILAMLGI